MSAGLLDLLSVQGITLAHSNVSSEANVGFEEKDDRHTAFVKVTDATFDTTAYLSLALGTSSKTITAAQAKTLPGVTAAENITIYAELYVDDLSGERDAALQVRFFDEAGEVMGSETTIAIDEESAWQQIAQRITVPASATRVNFYLNANCDAGETVEAWIANLKLTR